MQHQSDFTGLRNGGLGRAPVRLQLVTCCTSLGATVLQGELVDLSMASDESETENTTELSGETELSFHPSGVALFRACSLVFSTG